MVDPSQEAHENHHSYRIAEAKPNAPSKIVQILSGGESAWRIHALDNNGVVWTIWIGEGAGKAKWERVGQ